MANGLILINWQKGEWTNLIPLAGKIMAKG